MSMKGQTAIQYITDSNNVTALQISTRYRSRRCQIGLQEGVGTLNMIYRESCRNA